MDRHLHTPLAVIWFLGMATVAVALPGMAAGRVAAQGIGQASYSGVTFSYDKSLATGVRGETVPSNVGQSTLFSEIRPEHTYFTFDGYPSKGVWVPGIRVIPLAAYRMAQAESGLSTEFSSLERYLSGETGAPLPQLPPVNQARIINEKVVAVTGAGVSGVRFVAAYSQGIMPVSADNITYMFIGFTADRTYYVEGTFPVALSTPFGPAPSPVTAENAQAYNRAVAETLDDTDMLGFRPSLDNFDKMIASIRVHSPVIPGMPTTGAGTPLDAGLTFAILSLATLLMLVGLATFVRMKESHTR